MTVNDLIPVDALRSQETDDRLPETFDRAKIDRILAGDYTGVTLQDVRDLSFASGVSADLLLRCSRELVSIEDVRRILTDLVRRVSSTAPAYVNEFVWCFALLKKLEQDQVASRVAMYQADIEDNGVYLPAATWLDREEFDLFCAREITPEKALERSQKEGQ